MPRNTVSQYTATLLHDTSWKDGLEPMERPGIAARDNGFVSVIVILMLALCFSIKHIRRIWGTLVKRLSNTRRRQDFDHITLGERPAMAILLASAVFFIALVATAAVADFQPQVLTFSFDSVMRVTSFILVYFLFQYAVYETIGYAFSSDDGRRAWVEGFTASMSLLGVALIAPGLGVLFYPDVTLLWLVVAAFMYFLARLVFIFKGFRIFYTNIGSLVYFILYLCTLEIIPLAILYYLICL